MRYLLFATVLTTLIAGCSTPSQRMANCQAQGISRDACYTAEQNRQTAMGAAAEKQALENAQQVNGLKNK